MWKTPRAALMSVCLAILLTGCAAPQQVPVDPALTRAPVIPTLPEDATWRDLAEAHARALDELRDCGARMEAIRGE